MQTYTHVIPGMDELAAETVADLILRPTAFGNDCSILGSISQTEEAYEAARRARVVWTPAAAART